MVWPDPFRQRLTALGICSRSPADHVGLVSGSKKAFTNSTGGTLAMRCGSSARGGFDTGAGQPMQLMAMSKYSQTPFVRGTRLAATFNLRFTSFAVFSGVP